MLIYVRASVRPVQVCLELSIFIFIGQSHLRAITALRTQSENTHRAIREHSERNKSIKIRVIQLEPKILRLVVLAFCMLDMSDC